MSSTAKLFSSPGFGHIDPSVERGQLRKEIDAAMNRVDKLLKNTTIEAAERIEGSSKKVRVVSMPCWERFEEQSAEYKESVLPAGVTARVSVEAGSTFGWGKYVGDAGKSIGVDTFGASAPGPTLYEKFGITTDAVVAAAEEVMA